MHILINTIQSSSVVNSSATASWLPICLPKFNPAAFVNAYVTFLRRKDADNATPAQAPLQTNSNPIEPVESSVLVAEHVVTPASAQEQSDAGDQASLGNDTSSKGDSTSSSAPSLPVELGLLCVSGLNEFDAVRNWCTIASEVRIHLFLSTEHNLMPYLENGT